MLKQQKNNENNKVKIKNKKFNTSKENNKVHTLLYIDTYHVTNIVSHNVINDTPHNVPTPLYTWPVAWPVALLPTLIL